MILVSGNTISVLSHGLLVTQQQTDIVSVLSQGLFLYVIPVVELDSGGPIYVPHIDMTTRKFTLTLGKRLYKRKRLNS